MSFIDNTLFQQLQKGEKTAIKELYALAYNSCSKLILLNGGSAKEARALFQEVVLLFIKKIQAPNFQLVATPNVYMYSICRDLWAQHLLSISSKRFIQDADASLFLATLNEPKSTPIQQPKLLLINGLLEKLGADCKQILIAFYFKKMSIKEIAEQLNLNSAFVKVQKKRCMDSLKEQVNIAFSQANNNV